MLGIGKSPTVIVSGYEVRKVGTKIHHSNVVKSPGKSKAVKIKGIPDKETKKTENRVSSTSDDSPSIFTDTKECVTSSDTTEDRYGRKSTTTIL